MKKISQLKVSALFVAALLMTALMITRSTKTSAIFASREEYSTRPGSGSQAHMISNPAAAYCTDMRYQYQVISDAAGGQTDTCTMPDGVVCRAWDFLEGKCGQVHSYCARQGLGIRTATDGKNPYSREYAVCVDASGKDVGSVTVLDDLAAKMKNCGANGGSSGTIPDASNAT